MCLETSSLKEELLEPLLKHRLDEVVDAVKRALSDPHLRQLSQRAVQAKIWHEQPVVSILLQELRASEEKVRAAIFAITSKLVYQFNEHSVDATLQRAGIIDPSYAPTDVGTKCLDAKERLYIILKEYGWIQDFFRRYPIHFYENSFQFVDRIPTKDLPVKVKVIGLGIGGSMAVSGLAKRGIAVTGFEKRSEFGPGSVTSRYQNASWRAYDTAAGMVDDKAYDLLVQNRQRIHVKQLDGSTTIHESDRVQIILGAAISAALDSAREYGATLHFECSSEDYYSNDRSIKDGDFYDIVALFCGAHTANTFPVSLNDKIWEWPELDSTCKMWLRVQVSEHMDAYCTRGGEIGAEQWHYTIESARSDLHDLERVAWNQESQYKYNLRKLTAGSPIGISEQQLTTQYESQRAILYKVIETVKKQQNSDGAALGCRFDYIFTNAPDNDHNRAKRESVADTVVLEGGYTVEVKMATSSTVSSPDLLKKLGTSLVVLGGDACVPPNPLAAYGATLACESAASLVLLATGVGHLNSIMRNVVDTKGLEGNMEWIQQIEELKCLLEFYYESKARSETYFQFVQTLICNMYSLSAFY
jgi:hypothetical protein